MCTSQNFRDKLSEPELLLERMAIDEKFTGLRLSGTELKLFEKNQKECGGGITSSKII